MTKAPIPTENSKTKGQRKNAIKNLEYTTIADRLRTVSWSNNIHPTGVVKPICPVLVLFPEFLVSNILRYFWFAYTYFLTSNSHQKMHFRF